MEADTAGAWDGLAAQLQAMLDDPETAARPVNARPMGEMTFVDAVDLLVTGDLPYSWSNGVLHRLVAFAGERMGP